VFGHDGTGEGATTEGGSGFGITTDLPASGPPRALLSTPNAVGRRRQLPSGRAVLGGFLVASAAVIVFAATAARGGNGSSAVLVAARGLPAGSVISAGDLRSARVSVPAGSRAGLFEAGSAPLGRVLAVTLQPGEILERSMLVATGAIPQQRPVTIAVEPSSLVGIDPGQLVDVLVATGTGVGSHVSVVLRGAVLISDEDGTGSSTLSDQTGAVATLGVQTLAEVESVVQASEAGTVTLVAAERSDGTGPGPGQSGT
jgi:Flp pilus assembly protein CpaB